MATKGNVLPLDIYTDEYTGRVFRHQETDELLWCVSKELAEGGMLPDLVLCQCLCLTGPSTGHSRNLSPAYIDDWCELVEGNYEYEPGGTKLGLMPALLKAVVAFPV